MEELSIGALWADESRADFRIEVRDAQRRGKDIAKIHKQFTLMQKHQPDKTVEGIAWNFESMPEANEPVDIAVRLEWNTWNNVRLLE